MVQGFLKSVVPKKIKKYHLFFDNFFANADLIVYLKNVGLRATGTVRSNKVKAKNKVDKKAERET